MGPVETAASADVPLAPVTLEESGLNIDLVTQLVVKTLHFAGTLTGVELADRCAVYHFWSDGF